MINKFRKIALVFLCLIIAASTLYAADKESGISLFIGNDEALALSASEKVFFRTALRVDVKADILNTVTNDLVYGPFIDFEYTSPSLVFNGVRNVAHSGIGFGYNIDRVFANGMRFGGFIGYKYGGFSKTNIKYSAIEVGLDYMWPINQYINLQAKTGLAWRGASFSGYLQVGCGHIF